MKTWEALKTGLLSPVSELGLDQKTVDVLAKNDADYIAQIYSLSVDSDKGLTKFIFQNIQDALAIRNFPILDKTGTEALDGIHTRPLSLTGLGLDELAMAVEREKATFLKRSFVLDEQIQDDGVLFAGSYFTTEQFHSLSRPLDDVLVVYDLKALAKLEQPPLFLGQLLAYTRDDLTSLPPHRFNHIQGDIAHSGLFLGMTSTLKEVLFSIPGTAIKDEPGRPLRDVFQEQGKDHREAFKVLIYNLAEKEERERHSLLQADSVSEPSANGPS